MDQGRDVWRSQPFHQGWKKWKICTEHVGQVFLAWSRKVIYNKIQYYFISGRVTISDLMIELGNIGFTWEYNLLGLCPNYMYNIWGQPLIMNMIISMNYCPTNNSLNIVTFYNAVGKLPWKVFHTLYECSGCSDNL